MAEAKKKVVVVGGGVAGSKVAKDLEAFSDVTLIDPKLYFEIPYPAPRSTVEPSFADRTLPLYSDFLKQGKHVQSTAEKVTAENVVTASGETIPYDFLVITTGTVYTGPPTKEERIKEFEANKKKLVDAQSVLIIGGGPVGVELAGEIVTDFPEKKVTIVQGGPRILEFLGEKVSQKTSKWLQKRKVDVILDDRVDIEEDASTTDFETRKKVQIKADTYFLTVGKKVAIDWIRASDYLKNSVTSDGRLNVEPTTQVKDFPKIFAAGDITNFQEPKQGYLANEHSKIVVNNIKELIKNPSSKNLKSYKPQADPIGIVTLGRKEAIVTLPFGVFLGKIPGKLKSKDFFVSKSRGEVGLKAS